MWGEAWFCLFWLCMLSSLAKPLNLNTSCSTCRSFRWWDNRSVLFDAESPDGTQAMFVIKSSASLLHFANLPVQCRAACDPSILFPCPYQFADRLRRLHVKKSVQNNPQMKGLGVAMVESNKLQRELSDLLAVSVKMTSRVSRSHSGVN